MREKQATIDARTKLSRLAEFTSYPVHPDLQEFASLVSARLGDQIDHFDFVLAGEDVLRDLHQGVICLPSRAGEKGRSPFAGPLAADSGLLRRGITRIAQLTFPERFAENVRAAQISWANEFGLRKIDPAIFDTPEDMDKDRIKSPITTIEEGKRLIIDDARRRVVSSGWEHFGADMERVGEQFDLVAPLILRNADLGFSFNLLSVDEAESREILRNLPADQKMEISKGFWFGLLKPIVTGEEATHIRDHVWMKSGDAIAALNEISLGEAVQFFAKDINYRQAGKRIAIRLIEQGVI